ncbi:AN1-type zinc finger protein 2B isoform X2 [Pseudophryne corroboree]|uniref:AN1-type zinc finger protein 2B isoform X2 n=1 Tax=Pseudophryne corroboree TaxID=495146 RepID=UPI003081EF86
MGVQILCRLERSIGLDIGQLFPHPLEGEIMEFPNLGKHCSESTCKQLDFLPLKCDACEQIFCKDHVMYVLHGCSSAYKKDVQVPVCPLCNTPIPVKKGQTPDVVVGEHIDRDCKSDPAQQKRKIFTNKCGKPGCRQKELMKVICDDCHGNFCLKHRHPLDHECKGKSAPISRAGHAAVLRSQASSSKAPATSSYTAARPTAQPQRNRGSVPNAQPPAAAALQNGLSEEEALQRALEMSIAESAQNVTEQHSTQEEEDLALAQALSASEEEYRRQQVCSDRHA